MGRQGMLPIAGGPCTFRAYDTLAAQALLFTDVGCWQGGRTVLMSVCSFMPLA